MSARGHLREDRSTSSATAAVASVDCRRCCLARMDRDRQSWQPLVTRRDGFISAVNKSTCISGTLKYRCSVAAVNYSMRLTK